MTTIAQLVSIGVTRDEMLAVNQAVRSAFETEAEQEKYVRFISGEATHYISLLPHAEAGGPGATAKIRLYLAGCQATEQKAVDRSTAQKILNRSNTTALRQYASSSTCSSLGPASPRSPSPTTSIRGMTSTIFSCFRFFATPSLPPSRIRPSSSTSPPPDADTPETSSVGSSELATSEEGALISIRELPTKTDGLFGGVEGGFRQRKKPGSG
ncbi:unnamed protein product [Vitrella brassicaformis CCMP3155]|uniref:Uncharacterized protein n=1 Tax=Vitrella brassicaformis (strain CCMP3155) TaxID=1169540 RepID=A0A0G4H2F1_VITBC|nr:unnamed protein product [Vitrella brassicaformis CCMP3155]|eukprot:CEM37811.1 unnamed protein product [Vitrella brassicaformis CCMP3155]